MWVLIYAFLGFLYFLASTWKPIFSTIGIEALFPVYTFINIFCIFLYILLSRFSKGTVQK